MDVVEVAFHIQRKGTTGKMQLKQVNSLLLACEEFFRADLTIRVRKKYNVVTSSFSLFFS